MERKELFILIALIVILAVALFLFWTQPNSYTAYATSRPFFTDYENTGMVALVVLVVIVIAIILLYWRQQRYYF